MARPSPDLRVLSLCSGAGGLDLGLALAVGNARVVCTVEGEVYASEILATRSREGTLDVAPNWSDLRTFDPEPWVGVVDCVVMGIPCQGHSVAGLRRGADDPRHLWPVVVPILRALRPAFVVFENVPNILNTVFQTEILRDLASLGLDAEWDVFSAASVGAPHQRDRLFLLAYDPRRWQRGSVADAGCNGTDGLQYQGRSSGTATDFSASGGDALVYPECPNGRTVSPSGDGRIEGSNRHGEADGWAGEPGQTLAYHHHHQHDDRSGNVRPGWRSKSPDRSIELADSASLRRGTASGSRSEQDSHGSGEEVGNTHDKGPQGWSLCGRERADEQIVGPRISTMGNTDGERWLQAVRRDPPWGGPFAPSPSERDRWAAVLACDPSLAPAVEPEVCRGARGSANRVDRLRLGGNIVVPAQAAVAILVLGHRAGLWTLAENLA